MNTNQIALEFDNRFEMMNDIRHKVASRMLACELELLALNREALLREIGQTKLTISNLVRNAKAVAIKMKLARS